MFGQNLDRVLCARLQKFANFVSVSYTTHRLTLGYLRAVYRECSVTAYAFEPNEHVLIRLNLGHIYLGAING